MFQETLILFILILIIITILTVLIGNMLKSLSRKKARERYENIADIDMKNLINIAKYSKQMIDLLKRLDSWSWKEKRQFYKISLGMKDASETSKVHTKKLLKIVEVEVEELQLKKQHLENTQKELRRQKQCVRLERANSQRQVEDTKERIEAIDKQYNSAEKDEKTAIKKLEQRKNEKAVVPAIVYGIGALGTLGATIITGGLAAPVIGAVATAAGTIFTIEDCKKCVENARSVLSKIREDRNQKREKLSELKCQLKKLQTKLEDVEKSLSNVEGQMKRNNKEQDDHRSILQSVSRSERVTKECLAQIGVIFNTAHCLEDCVKLLTKQKRDIMHHLAFIENSINNIVMHLCNIVNIAPPTKHQHHALKQRVQSLQMELRNLQLTNETNDIDDFL